MNKDNRNTVIIKLYALILGLFFVISAWGKAADSHAFEQLLQSYGLELFSWTAPWVILIELAVGLSLMLNGRVQLMASISLGMLMVFTAAFAWGHFVHGINNCGCFGTIKAAEMPPWLTFLRNFILMGITIPLIRKKVQDPSPLAAWKGILMCIILSAGAWLTGITTHPKETGSQISQSHPLKNKEINQTPFLHYINPDKSKKYLIYCFSYSCPHCWNSIENLRRFKSSGTVDEIIALAVGTPEAKKEFQEKIQPDFEVVQIPQDSMDLITLTYPTAFMVHHKNINDVITEGVPSPFIYQKQKPN